MIAPASCHGCGHLVRTTHRNVPTAPGQNSVEWVNEYCRHREGAKNMHDCVWYSDKSRARRIGNHYLVKT